VALKDIPFDQWLKYVFDHPANDRDWHFRDDFEWWDSSDHPAQTFMYVTRLFENILSATASYSDAQIAHGLWFIASSSSGFLYTSANIGREQTLTASYHLFEQLFAKRCSPHLSHTIRSTEPTDINPLNMTCYMWWDLDWISPVQLKINELALDIMERTLQLDSIACQESALHGLGHWKSKYPERVTTIIDQFLKRETTLSDALKVYAQAARAGCVQ
jgi:hypothetical protein